VWGEKKTQTISKLRTAAAPETASKKHKEGQLTIKRVGRRGEKKHKPAIASDEGRIEEWRLEREGNGTF